jgi:hypothetical protein
MSISMNSSSGFWIDVGRDSFHLSPVRAYSITGRLIAKKYYGGNDPFALIAPFDLGIAWGKLIEPQYHKHMRYSQWDRWLSYNWSSLPRGITVAYILSHVSNNHIVPANGSVYSACANLRVGQRITITGKLVDISSDGFLVSTSRTTTDSGDGACEIIYATQLQTQTPKTKSFDTCPYCSHNPGYAMHSCESCREVFWYRGFPTWCQKCSTRWYKVTCRWCGKPIYL